MSGESGMGLSVDARGFERRGRGRLALAMASLVLVGLTGTAGAQQLSGDAIQAALAVDGAGNATASCGNNGNALTTALNTVLGTPGFDDEGVGVSQRRGAFRYCDSLTATGAQGWTGDAQASPEQIAAQATSLAPEEVFMGMDNAHASYNVQASNVARRLSLVRLARRGERDRAEALAANARRDGSAPGAADPAGRLEAERRGFARLEETDRAERVLLALQEGINAGDGTEGGLGFFLNGRVNALKGDANGAERSSDGFGGGFTLGVDTALSDELFAGIALGYTRISTDYDGTASEADLDAVTVTGYGAFYPSDALYVDGSVSISYLGFEQSNALVIFDGGAPVGDLEGDADGVNFGFDVGVGYALDVGDLTGNEDAKGFTIEPLARLNFLLTWVEDYVQSGGDGTLDLSIDEQEAISVTGTFGFRTEYPISTRHGVLTPYLRAAYVHEFNDENDDVEVGIAAVGGPTIKLKPEATDSHYANFGAGVAATLGQGLSQFLDYDVIAAHDNVTIHQVTAGMRFEF